MNWGDILPNLSGEGLATFRGVANSLDFSADERARAFFAASSLQLQFLATWRMAANHAPSSIVAHFEPAF